MSSELEPIQVPYRILVDSREQAPYHFRGLLANASQKKRPLLVPTRVVTLQTGDYSIDGLQDRIAVERKALSDAFGTFGGGRDRFERELERLNAMECAAVVIEGNWGAIVNYKLPENEMRFTPMMFHRSVIAWQQDFPRVHWWTCDTKEFAERTTFRILQRFWNKLEVKP